MSLRFSTTSLHLILSLDVPSIPAGALSITESKGKDKTINTHERFRTLSKLPAQRVRGSKMGGITAYGKRVMTEIRPNAERFCPAVCSPRACSLPRWPSQRMQRRESTGLLPSSRSREPHCKATGTLLPRSN